MYLDMLLTYKVLTRLAIFIYSTVTVLISLYLYNIYMFVCLFVFSLGSGLHFHRIYSDILLALLR